MRKNTFFESDHSGVKKTSIPLRWQDWRPIHKWLFVKADPRVKKTRGGIELPDQQVMVERVMEGTGRLLKVGNREEIQYAVGADLEPGMRICFRGFLKDAFQEFEKDADGCAIFMLRAEDVMAIIPEGVTMGAFS
jgi:co-chaperonin GroES (HSP10)